ncbi:hypothetical protein AB205_0143040 [Aquarana catesbeiana]|uniref:Uncharacterized protein n=1 Tax=Aquarana catesbeiana TaxID=8400 RepID=A0A2G9RUX3_AQUCT|nr:hypothetical protein AB205_0143040 [Aquarana catesbeiana]
MLVQYVSITMSCVLMHLSITMSCVLMQLCSHSVGQATGSKRQGEAASSPQSGAGDLLCKLFKTS